MTQPLFHSTIGTHSRSAKFLTINTVVKKMTVTPGPGAWTRRCLRKWRGGGGDLLKIFLDSSLEIDMTTVVSKRAAWEESRV